MRLRFWQPGAPTWQDGDWKQRDPFGDHAHSRVLCLPAAPDGLWISLTVSLSDVILQISSDDREASTLHGLAECPLDAPTVRADVVALLAECGCDDSQATRVTHPVLEELQRLVPAARLQRARRLSELPTNVLLAWDGPLSHEAFTGAKYAADDSSIELRLKLHRGFSGYGVSVMVASARRGCHRESGGVVAQFDGICCEGVVQHLEMWGWPRHVALGVGHAVAVKAHADGMADLKRWLAERSQLRSTMRKLRERDASER